MKIEEMINVMQAFRDGAEIEYTFVDNEIWAATTKPVWNWDYHDYRIAPKKEMTLVERLRTVGGVGDEAADRIEWLETKPMEHFTTDELINDIRTRLIDKC
jgi:hypothetical protein